MYFVKLDGGQIFDSAVNMLQEICRGRGCMQCPLDNVPFGPCYEAVKTHPELIAELGGFEQVLEPGDDGYIEQTDISSVDIEDIFALLGG